MSDEPFFFPTQHLCLLEPVTWSKIQSAYLHKKATSLLINWTGLVSGRWHDWCDLATTIPLFLFCLQNSIVTTDGAKPQAVGGPSQVLGYEGGLKHARYQETLDAHTRALALYSCTAEVSAFKKGLLFTLQQIYLDHVSLATYRQSVWGSIKSLRGKWLDTAASPLLLPPLC